jgi:carotenoid 1,2-hydratase
VIEPLPANAPTWRRAIAEPGGYAWWYVDALTPSGDGLVCILFLGSVFSSKYAARWKRGERARPLEHCAVNLALYRGGRRVGFVMSEYDRAGAAEADRLAIGESTLSRDGATVTIALRDRTVPGHARVAGTITVEPLAPAWPEYRIVDDLAGHAWQVLAPRARVRAELPTQRFALDAEGYFDHNAGAGRIEASVARWSWARFAGPHGLTVVYGLEERSGAVRAIRFDEAASGAPRVSESDAAPTGAARRLRWGMQLPEQFGARGGWRCQAGATLEEAPFYSRYRAQLVDPSGARIDGHGEHIDFDRFSRGLNLYLVRWMTRPLPFHPFPIY